MKLTKFLTVSLLLIVTLTACSGGVSQEEYNKLLAENKELQEQLDTYKSYFSEEDNESEAEEDADEITNELTEEIYENAPTVTYEDIESGNYNEQYAKINCVVYDVVYDDENDELTLNAWISNGDTLFQYDRGWSLSDFSKRTGILELKDAQDGDSYEICIYIYEDFTSSRFLSAKKIDKIDELSNIEQTFKAGCKTYSCEEILRQPNQHSGEAIKFTGEVFQVISQSDTYGELLIETSDENGFVYVNFYKNEEDERLLEGDLITAYGYYHRLYTYTSTAGSKRTVPELSAIFIERN